MEAFMNAWVPASLFRFLLFQKCGLASGLAVEFLSLGQISPTTFLVKWRPGRLLDFDSIYKSLLAATTPVLGVASAGGFASLLASFTIGSLQEFNELDRELDLAQFAKDDLLSTSFDFIVVGAGAAGSILAAKLAAEHRVLLLEAGGEPHPFQSIPALALGLLGQPSIDWMTRSVPQKHSALAHVDQRVQWASGKNLGGSGNLNSMLFTRGSHHDYDNWANQTQAPRWAFKSILKFYKELEFWDDPSLSTTGGQHGKDGKLRIGYPGWMGIWDRFVDAGVEHGLNRLSDINLPFENHGVGPFPQNHRKDGRRLTSFQAYVEPMRNHPNLRIMKFAHVRKVILNKNREAKGVEYERHGAIKEAFATKEVILCAGAVRSAQILMLSGIGPAKHLGSLQIPLVVDLPVGSNLQDHVGAFQFAFVINESLTFNVERDVTPGSFFEFMRTGRGPLSSTHLLSTAYMASEVGTAMGQAHWPDLQLILIDLSIGKSLPGPLERIMNLKEGTGEKYMGDALDKDAFGVVVVLSRPESRGTVRLNKLDPYGYPEVDPNYFSHPNDIKRLVEGLRRSRSICEDTSAMRRLNSKLSRSRFPGCEEQALFSDPYWECLARHWTQSIWHPTGTCAMGPKGSPKAVLDPKLRVLGVGKLRVIDASIAPFIPSGNTHASSLLIGQVGASLVLEAWTK